MQVGEKVAKAEALGKRLHVSVDRYTKMYINTFARSTQLGHKPHCSTIKGSVFTSTFNTETVSLHNYNCGVGLSRVDLQRCVNSLYVQCVCSCIEYGI